MLRISSFATGHWYRERERRARPDLALDPDLAAVQFDELPRQGQAEPRALDLFGGHPHLLELLENRLLILRRDTDPGVTDRYLHGAVHRFSLDLDPAALRRELDRVRQEIEENLTELPLVL